MADAKEHEYTSLIRRVAYKAPAGRKWCPRCKRMLDKSKFKPNSHRAGGLRSWCMECDKKERKKQWETKGT